MKMIMKMRAIVAAFMVTGVTSCFSQHISHPGDSIQDLSLFPGTQFSFFFDSNVLTNQTTNAVHCQIKNKSTNAIDFRFPFVPVVAFVDGHGKNAASFIPKESFDNTNSPKIVHLQAGESFGWTVHFVLEPVTIQSDKVPIQQKSNKVELLGDYQVQLVLILEKPEGTYYRNYVPSTLRVKVVK